MDIKTIINKKRGKAELTKDEIKYFVGKYQKGEISDAQAASLMSYMYLNGLTLQEIVDLTKEVAESGDRIDLSQLRGEVVDKHSTGGIGDKISLILLPLVASLNIPVAKIASRTIGVTSGTIDKLNTIPGFDSNISLERFEKLVEINKIAIAGQELNLAPVEGKLYRLRNEIACGSSIPLIAISLMSLKLSTGAKKIVFDLSCGKGTYLKNRNEAKKLGKLLVLLGKKLDRQVGYTITIMDEPIGYSIGNVLEMKETIKALKGEMAKDVQDTVFSLASIILSLAFGEKDFNKNVAKAKEAILTGKALKKFKQFIYEQSGDIDYIEDISKFPEAKYIVPVYATESGFVESIDAELVGDLARYLGAGRMNSEKQIDNTSGFVFKKKIGDEVQVGEVIAYIHANDEQKAIAATKNLPEAYKYTQKIINPRSRVLEMHGM